MNNEKDLETIIRYIHKDLSDIKHRYDKLSKQFVEAKQREKDWSELVRTVKSDVASIVGYINKLFCECSDMKLNPNCKVHCKYKRKPNIDTSTNGENK